MPDAGMAGVAVVSLHLRIVSGASRLFHAALGERERVPTRYRHDVS
jgi:hypothetical protein